MSSSFKKQPDLTVSKYSLALYLTIAIFTLTCGISTTSATKLTIQSTDSAYAHYFETLLIQCTSKIADQLSQCVKQVSTPVI